MHAFAKICRVVETESHFPFPSSRNNRCPAAAEDDLLSRLQFVCSSGLPHRALRAGLAVYRINTACHAVAAMIASDHQSAAELSWWSVCFFCLSRTGPHGMNSHAAAAAATPRNMPLPRQTERSDLSKIPPCWWWWATNSSRAAFLRAAAVGVTLALVAADYVVGICATTASHASRQPPAAAATTPTAEQRRPHCRRQ